ncbi:diguanylate cyclase [uncultured Xylophilus sp.]|uniref:GGDEF domain-containing protein n=1 Tax=uncultured Xylophilus sp. TaxID=296832 RepID=UPI0025F81F7A|nr:diguanylate cyclase [uncultured Xylophilus sp.]
MLFSKTMPTASDKKLVYVVIPIIILLQIAGYFYLIMANRQIAMDTLDGQLGTGARAYRFVAAQRGAYLKSSADLLTKDFGFLDAVGTEDPATIESALQNLSKRLDAHVAVLLDLNGQVVAQSSARAFASQDGKVADADLERIAQRYREGQPNLFPLQPDGDSRLFKWTRTAVRNPTPAGAVLLGFEINRAVLAEFKNVTNLDFAYVSAAPGEPWTAHASSLAWDTRSVAHAGLQYANGTAWTEQIDGENYRVMAVDMNGSSEVRVVSVVATPYGPTLRPFRRLEHLITAASLLLCFASIVTIRRTTRKIVSPLAAEVERDALTRLANRRAFDNRMELADAYHQQQGRGFAVALMDLNKFKAINDNLGHAAGDEVLKAVAGRLPPLVRNSDTVARLGGDEFAFLIYTQDVPQLSAIAGAIVERVRQPILLPDGQEVAVGASIGIAVCSAKTGERATELLEKADAAMYRAKQGGGGFVFAS